MRRLLIALPLLLAAATACSKVTKANYDKLTVGMSYDDVVKILGKPAKCQEAMIAQSCTWGDEKRNITVNFIGKQVILYTGTNLK